MEKEIKVNKKWIFFDLDITLIDIKKAQYAAIEDLYNIYNFKGKTDLESFIKKWDELTDYHYAFYTRKEISYEEQRNRRIIDLFKAYNMEMDKTPKEIYAIYLKSFEDNWCLFDDVYDVIKRLYEQGYVLGVISNGDLEQQTDKLRRTGILKFFEIVTTSSEYEYSKPDPQLYESIVARFGIDKNKMLMIGDQVEKDVLPCHEIGIDAIWLNRKNKENNNNVKEIKSLKELLNIEL
ncbi:MAG: HAD family hydrolase [Clostridia bacterium]|nr:HAD family hydrolase [Clostridia bacterium]